MDTPQSIAEMAAAECRASTRAWDLGGSDLHGPNVPPRPRPQKEPKRSAAPLNTEFDTYDEALEHVNWYRSRGMTPGCVAESIGADQSVSTWSLAVSLIEQEILRMRRAHQCRRQ